MDKNILHVVSSDAVKERVFQLINSSKNEEIVVSQFRWIMAYYRKTILRKN